MFILMKKKRGYIYIFLTESKRWKYNEDYFYERCRRGLFGSAILKQTKSTVDLTQEVKVCQSVEYNCPLEIKNLEWHFF